MLQMGDYLYALLIYPIEMFIETVFTLSMKTIPSAGYAILFVSIAVQLLALPMYKRADEIQEEEHTKQKELSGWIKHIKKHFRGDEQLMMLSEYYRQNSYQPWYSLRGMLPLLLQIPFFIAAYHFLSNCKALDGASFYFLSDMGKPDGMISVGGIAINVMPILMTIINLVSGMIYTRDLGLKDRIQLYITAGVFLVLLYDSPSGLVFYWTLNNVFSLLKNVFMKLVKNPRPVISIGAVLFVCAYCLKCYRRGAWETEGGRIILCTVFIIGIIPFLGWIFERKLPAIGEISPDEKKLFRLAMLISTVSLGVMIPTGVMSTSPLEFIIKGHYVSPLVQVIYTCVVACGLFMVWGNLIFAFSSGRAKKIMAYTMFALTICGLVNYLFFSSSLNSMSMHMQYYMVISYDTQERLINLGVLMAICTLLYLLFKYKNKVLLYLGSVVFVASLVLSCYSIFTVQNTIDNTTHIKDDDYYINNEARISLDKKGNNVVVMMLDRAFGQYIPYIMNEKPELKKVYSDFTWYRNTVSYGMATLVGAPPLWGGYEYTPYNLRGKGADARDESIKVLPKLFASKNYRTTVLDPLDFVDYKGKSIEEFYHDVDPSIKAFQIDSALKTADEAQRDYDYFVHAARANYIRHSIFISSPLALRFFLIDDDAYLMQEEIDDRVTYAGRIEALDRMSDITEISDTGSDTFTIMINNTPHSQKVTLQMPDYTLEEDADNSPYMEKWLEMLDETSDRPINMYMESSIESYAVNMATILSVGRWIDYLKDNDIYDNTRIILVADHGYYVFTFDDMLFDRDGVYADLDMFAPLLMEKDFGDAPDRSESKSGPAVSDEFMTNADVPVLATEGLIDHPVNPFTGKEINSAQKRERVQYIPIDGHWLSVHDSIYDLNNWEVADDAVK